MEKTENEQKSENTHVAETTVLDCERLVEDEETLLSSNNKSVISKKHGIPKDGMTLELKNEMFRTTKSRTEKEFYDYEFDSKAGGKEMTWKGLYKQLETLLVFSDPGLDLYFDPASYMRNRYRTVLPYVCNRVKLEEDTNHYINASYVSVEKVAHQYIVTQGPMDNTISHFWEMVWEQQTFGIVMLCKCEEKGNEKCAQYWPTKRSGSIIAGVFMIEYLSCEFRGSYRLSSLELNNLETGESRKIFHYHYTSWPDFGVPQSPNVFLRFLMDVRRSGVMKSGVGPVVVHCSAGIGRSGVFTLSDVCISLIENEMTLTTLDITKLLHHMRMQRLGLVQTAEQLRFTYLAILTAAHSMGLSQSISELQREAKNVTGSENECSTLPKLVYVRPAVQDTSTERLLLSQSLFTELECSANFPQPVSGSAVQSQISPSPSMLSLFSIESYSSTGTADNIYTLASPEPTSIQTHSSSPITASLDEEYLMNTTGTETTDTVLVNNVRKRNEKKMKKMTRSWFKRLKHKMLGHTKSYT